MIPPGITQYSVDLDEAQGTVDGKPVKLAQLTITHVAGSLIMFLDPKDLETMGMDLAMRARQMGTRLQIAGATPGLRQEDIEKLKGQLPSTRGNGNGA